MVFCQVLFGVGVWIGVGFLCLVFTVMFYVIKDYSITTTSLLLVRGYIRLLN